MKNKSFSMVALVIIGVILISIVSFTIIRSNQTIEAYVPAKNLSNGHVIQEDDLKVVQVPVGTPEGYIRNKEQLINHKVRTDVQAGQLLYESNFLNSWESYTEEIDIPENFIVATFTTERDHSCDNLIVNGDYIDILGISEEPSPAFEEDVDYNTRNVGIDSYVYYILSNVKVLGTNNTNVSEDGEDEEGNSSSNSEYNTFIIALSYEDYKKLKQAEGCLDLWVNIVPKQNNVEGEDGTVNPPLISQMVGQSFSKLHDASQEVMDKDGNIIDSDVIIDEIKVDTDSDIRDSRTTNTDN